jgi:hypothetical protein
LAFRRALIVALLAAPAICGAADESARVAQERVKAAFLYKFASYVEWPGDVFARPDSPIVIGIAGSERLSRELQQAVGGRQVAGRVVEVRQLQPDMAPGECCQILFIGAASRQDRSTELLAVTTGRPVLTVTESRDHPSGSIINFLVLDDRVRFDISREAAERNGVQLRAQLLAVARQVDSR